MSKRSKKLEEIKNMFRDVDIDFNCINDNAINVVRKPSLLKGIK